MKKTVDFLSDHTNREGEWQKFWDSYDVYKFDNKSTKPLFTIDAPPPTISGKLHMGHVFSYTQADIIARFKRLFGFSVFNPFCIDNNGLPTERLMIKTEGLDPQKLGLGSFYKNVYQKIGEYENLYESLFKNLGFCYDYSLKYSSISLSVQKMTQNTFLDLYRKGIIYRKDSPALYCPECKTAIAQAEVEDRSIDGMFYDIQFFDHSHNPQIISTTRPEFIPACVGVCVNPQDNRYKHLIGTKITTPAGDTVPVFSDEKADPNKGSGMVMVCSYGDETDLYWIRNYNLDEKIIIDHNGHLCNTGINGMDDKEIVEGRAIIIEWLESKKLLKDKRQIKHDVGTHERCHTPIEILPIKQWFVKTLEYKNDIGELAKQVNFYPKHFEKIFLRWVENLKWDWCISRERYFGIPMPIFYCGDCNEVIMANVQDLPVDPRLSYKSQHCPKCLSKNIVPETNVLDTWFTASQTPDINGYWPMSMRTQAHDNISVWSFYSMVMGVIKHNNTVPWYELMTAGHLLVKKGEKISKKTGGGAYNPNNLIAEHGVDAIRYAMCQAKLGTDAYFEEENVARGKKLITKLINAYRLVLLNLDNNVSGDINSFDNFDESDKWILNKYGYTLKKVVSTINKYEGGLALQIIEDFFWKYFCDNYLEIAKQKLKSEDNNSKKSTKVTLRFLMFELIKLFGAYLPYIAEELYHSKLVAEELIIDGNNGFYQTNGEKSVHLLPLRKMEINFDKELDLSGELLISKISALRKIKFDSGKKFNEEIERIKIIDTKENIEKLKKFEVEMLTFSRANVITFERGKDAKTEMF
jgi:valyl-tRNA synthetase